MQQTIYIVKSPIDEMLEEKFNTFNEAKEFAQQYYNLNPQVLAVEMVIDDIDGNIVTCNSTVVWDHETSEISEPICDEPTECCFSKDDFDWVKPCEDEFDCCDDELAVEDNLVDDTNIVNITIPATVIVTPHEISDQPYEDFPEWCNGEYVKDTCCPVSKPVRDYTNFEKPSISPFDCDWDSIPVIPVDQDGFEAPAQKISPKLLKSVSTKPVTEQVLHEAQAFRKVDQAFQKAAQNLTRLCQRLFIDAGKNKDVLDYFIKEYKIVEHEKAKNGQSNSSTQVSGTPVTQNNLYNAINAAEAYSNGSANGIAEIYAVSFQDNFDKYLVKHGMAWTTLRGNRVQINLDQKMEELKWRLSETVKLNNGYLIYSYENGKIETRGADDKPQDFYGQLLSDIWDAIKYIFYTDDLENRLVITNKPKKVKYIVGEQFEANGLTVEFNGKPVELSECKITPKDGDRFDEEGKPKLVVKYTAPNGKEYSAETDLEVIKQPEEVVESKLVIKHNPNKITYTVGDKFTREGLQVFLATKDKKEDVTDKVTLNPADGEVLNTEGKIKLVVTYKAPDEKEYTADVELTVNKPGEEQPVTEKLVVKQKPTKVSYTVGEEFNSDGLMVVLAKGNKETDVTKKVTLNPANKSKLDTVGTIQIKVTYHSYETSFDIEVKKQPADPFVVTSGANNRILRTTSQRAAVNAVRAANEDNLAHAENSTQRIEADGTVVVK